MFLAAKYVYKKAKARNTNHGVEFVTTRSHGDEPKDLTEPTEPTEPAEPTEAEAKAMRIYRIKLLAALFLPYFLGTLDFTIVATAVPYIASHFDKFDQLNWVVTAYTLTSTTFIPAFGQLADVFGRHVALQLAVFLMLVGSVLCAAAQDWAMLLFGRAVQGVSSAGILNIIMVVLVDRGSLADNAKNNSFFALVGGVAYSVGPVMGGYLTSASWRYCFVIAIPISVLSHILIYLLLRHDLVEGTHFKKGSRLSSILPALATLDLVGMTLFVFGVGLIILGTAWGGATYPWTSPKVVAPIVVGAVCFILFFVYEYLLEPGRVFARIFPRQTPMLPYSIFSRIDTLWLAILQFATGAAMFSVFYFISIFFILVEAWPSSKAGVSLLYYIPGLGAGVYSAVFLCNVWPRQTFVPLAFGTFAETIGLALVTWAIHSESLPLIKGMLALAGAGTGIRLMPSTLHVAGVWPERIAAAMSLMRFAMPFGGTLTLTIMGSVFNNKFGAAVSSLTNTTTTTSFNAVDTSSLSFIDDLPAAEQAVVRAAGKQAIVWAFLAIMPIMGISLVTGWFIGNVWIKGRGQKHSEVIYVPYLYALLKGVDSKQITEAV
ncbi:hypothetical protein ASPZODRAFT_15276 [Penicilliopsis zonata CBS 506.65]|uniref:Major facilitator superfamily (MFS) profile domain-containing protein n=1 Tax=Penicilliopsis zonata CBS 506.65 TaxID=1073090 RepID=A0A1L9SL73_9EURO|nr:hypothetical protein ASPZODRAFT_15276 [Penicilliopsis zonata CBS 506.65]OJJ47827.1 hypothetical protein ASPZODRAFT_15276 [Penicilliopsis zonata CBS 506.65]